MEKWERAIMEMVKERIEWALASGD